MGKSCIITGGANGIGRAISECLFSEGYNIVIFDKDLRSLKKTACELEEKYNIKNKIIIIEGSVEDINDVKKMAETCKANFNSIDALVNNAGIYSVEDVFTESQESFEKIIKINLEGTFLCCKTILDYMKIQRNGKIVNMSSISGKKQSIFASASYCASKAGIIGLTRYIAAQVAKYNINVNCVAPGGIETEMLTKTLTEEQFGFVKSTIPLGRIGKSGDVAKVVSFLLSENSSFITGETININGGSFME